MREIRVTYHQEPEGWWAETADLPGYSAWGADLDEVMELAKEGVPFFAEDAGLTDIHLVHVAPMTDVLQTAACTTAAGTLVGVVTPNDVWHSPSEETVAEHSSTAGIELTTT